VAGLVVSGIVPLAVLPGGPWLFAAAGLVLLAALADTADGALALITSRATRMGAFYDSVADRLTEAAWLGALWLAGVPGILVATCGALAWLHEYARSRAAAVGLRNIGVVTVAERPTRVIVVVAAFVAGGATAYLSDRLSAGAMTVVLAFWVVLSLLGSARLLGAIRASDRQSG
jgi:CDP-diacylglycerol--glycerol-3-phosphate 3-phosphatidyltransferase